ncbi:MAG: Gfo/Idh/MocA family oxidoreductase, partial [Abditibacteriota bacterium]|nr:Gfo/Idh/MocA family oxidoreductase [Abditibacteriota bacterium]
MKKFNVGIIGAGSIAYREHIPNINKLENVKVTAVADVNDEVLRNAATEYDIKNTFTDYKKMLESDEIDAVHVCTPNFAHMNPVIDALEAGKHVLCEKPIARTVAEAEQMKAAAERTGKKLMIAQCMR